MFSREAVARKYDGGLDDGPAKIEIMEYKVRPPALVEVLIANCYESHMGFMATSNSCSREDTLFTPDRIFDALVLAFVGIIC